MPGFAGLDNTLPMEPGEWYTVTATWGSSTTNVYVAPLRRIPRVWDNFLERARWELLQARPFFATPVRILVELVGVYTVRCKYTVRCTRWRARWERNPLHKRALSRRR